ncbi:hypothetical protein BC829DRAFT_386996, partial [Chytridium lagenaria]
SKKHRPVRFLGYFIKRNALKRKASPRVKMNESYYPHTPTTPFYMLTINLVIEHNTLPFLFLAMLTPPHLHVSPFPPTPYLFNL